MTSGPDVQILNNFTEMFVMMLSIKIAQTIQFGWTKRSPELKIEYLYIIYSCARIQVSDPEP